MDSKSGSAARATLSVRIVYPVSSLVLNVEDELLGDHSDLKTFSQLWTFNEFS